MSIIRSEDRSKSLKTNGFRLRSTYVIPAWPAAPSFVSAGTVNTNTVATAISWPTGYRTNDLGLLVVESDGADSTASVTTPTGWAHVTGSPIVDVASTSGSKLNVLWKFAASESETNPTVADPGDHVTGRIYTFRNVRTDITPGRAYATDTKTVASTSCSWPSVNTVAHNSLVICIASRPDDTASTTTWSAFANTNLTIAGGQTGQQAGAVTGTGGGFCMYYGEKATPGSTGVSTATLGVSVTNALITLALEPTFALPA